MTTIRRCSFIYFVKTNEAKHIQKSTFAHNKPKQNCFVYKNYDILQFISTFPLLRKELFVQKDSNFDNLQEKLSKNSFSVLRYG